jgi:hypothetical protein
MYRNVHSPGMDLIVALAPHRTKMMVYWLRRRSKVNRQA